MLGLGEFLPSNMFMDILAAITCSEGSVQEICESVMFLLCGFDEAQVNRTLLETIVRHTPAGCSTRYNFTSLFFASKFYLRCSLLHISPILSTGLNSYIGVGRVRRGLCPPLAGKISMVLEF